MAKYSADDRRRMAKNGQAMSDGSYPIMDASDLASAIQLVGNGSNSKGSIKAHIIRRAKALGLTKQIPDSWQSNADQPADLEQRLVLGAPERRSIAPSEFEIRSGQGNMLIFDGYASIFDYAYDVRGGPDAGGWSETVDRAAFERSLSRQPDVHLLVNHDGWSLARTKSGTMQLSTDTRGLRARAELDRRDPDVQRLEVKMERKDMDEMSFSFITLRHDLNKETAERRLLEVDINKRDVSIVNNGASDATHAGLTMHDALSTIRSLDDVAMAEVRSQEDRAELVEAHQILSRLLTDPSEARGHSLAYYERQLEDVDYRLLTT